MDVAAQQSGSAVKASHTRLAAYTDDDTFYFLLLKENEACGCVCGAAATDTPVHAHAGARSTEPHGLAKISYIKKPSTVLALEGWAELGSVEQPTTRGQWRC